MAVEIITKAILCIASNGGLGRNGKLLGDTPGDLFRFKQLTEGDAIFMGYKTADSLPGGKPLVNRINYVVCRFYQVADYAYRGFIPIVTRSSISDGLYKAQKHYSTIVHDEKLDFVNTPATLWVIGGAEVYKETLAHPTVSEYDITINPTLSLNADVFFNIEGLSTEYFCEDEFTLDEKTHTTVRLYSRL